MQAKTASARTVRTAAVARRSPSRDNAGTASGLRSGSPVRGAGDQADATPAVRAVRATVAVPIADLRPGDSARSRGLDADHIRVLAGVEGPLPPILVHRATMRVIDGAHRVAAARLRGLSAVAVEYFDGTNEEAFRLGVAANIAHGLPLTLADRRSAAVRIIKTQPLLSDRVVARSTGLSHKTVGTLRAVLEAGEPVRSASRVGLDGRVRPLDAAEGRVAAARIIAERPDASLREIARESGISLGTAQNVRARMLAGKSPLPDGRTAPARAAWPAPAELDDAMEFLRRDPTLRYSDSGRGLLRWLAARTLTVEQWRQSSGEVPPHSRAALARVARECASAWSTIAEELEGF